MKYLKSVHKPNVENNQKMGIMILLSFFLLFSFVLINSCSDSTSTSSSDTVTFSGTVTLEGETVHSGVTISLYETVELDTALMRINQQYPNIGVQISQETEFNHHELMPVYSTTSNADGSWKIDGVKQGIFNIVAEKDSFYFESRHQVDNKIESNIELRKIQYITGTSFSDFHFEQNKVYQIANAATFTNPIFDSNVLILLMGKVVFKDAILNTNRIINSKFIGMNSFAGLTFTDMNEIVLDHIIIENLNYTLKFFNIDQLKLQNCRIDGIKSEINFNQVRTLLIEDCIFRNNSETIDLIGCDSSNVKNNIFYNTEDGLNLSTTDSEINNNYFIQNRIGLVVHLYSDINIHNNVFENNTLCGAGLFGCVGTVRYNKFIGISKYYVSANSEYVQGYFQNPDIIVQFNNFVTPASAVYAMSTVDDNDLPGDLSGVGRVIDATNNFWNRLAGFEIESIIRGHDKVNYNNFTTNIILNAGIED